MEFSQNYLSKENTNCLKGIFALIIIACHLRNNISFFNDTIMGQMLTASGYLSVAVYFFFSGYGLMFQYTNKHEDYIKDFPKKRILDIYIKYTFLILLYTAFYSLLGQTISLKHFVKSFFFGGTVVANGWYMQVIVLTYIVFYFVMRFLPKRMVYPGFLGNFILVIALSMVMDLKILWYQSYLAYFVGILWANKKEKVDEFLATKYKRILVLSVSFVFFCLTLLLGNLNIVSLTPKIISKVFSSAFFVVFVIVLFGMINVKNKLTTFLGKISFEIYVIHGIFLCLFRYKHMYVNNDLLYALLVYVFSVATAIILNKLFILISKKIKG